MSAQLEAVVPVAPPAASAGDAPDPHRRWSPGPLTLGALGVWLASRVALFLAVFCGNFTIQVTNPFQGQRPVPFLDHFAGWDAHWYLDIAQHGYLYGPDQADHYGRGTAAFFPGEPLLIRIAHPLVGNWTVAGLLVSAVASALACVGLARLVDVELERAGIGTQLQRRSAALLTVACLVLSPMAVFLTAPYAEGPWLAAGVFGWLAARRGQWLRAGVLVAVAASMKPNGLFLAAGVAVMYVVSRRRDGRPLIAPAALALAIPAIPPALYTVYLHHRTGDWNAWQHAQQNSWGRFTDSPISAFSRSLDAARSVAVSDYAWAWRSELVVAVAGLALLCWLLYVRRWADLAYLSISWLALGADGAYLSFPRSTLLWIPLWLLLSRVIVRRMWVAWAWLSMSAPLALILAVAFGMGHWVN